MAPDPLEPANIPGQNPSTPQRLPGATDRPWHTRKRTWIVAAIIAAVIVGYAAVLIGALSTDDNRPTPTVSR